MKSKKIIESFLKDNEVTISSFIKRAGIGRTAFYDFFSGRNPVSLTLVNKMLRVCGYELVPMPLSTSKLKPPTTSDSTETQRRYRRSSKSQKAKMNAKKLNK